MKKKRKAQHSLHFHAIFTLFIVIERHRRNIIFLLFFIKNFISLAFAIRSRSLCNFFDFCSKSRRCFFFFFRRDFFLCVSFCLRYVNEIRSLNVIKSMIILIFFIYFVDETRSITLCSLAKSKRRCLKNLFNVKKSREFFRRFTIFVA